MNVDATQTMSSNHDVYREMLDVESLYFDHAADGRLGLHETSEYWMISNLLGIESFVRHVSHKGTHAYSPTTCKWLAGTSNSMKHHFASMQRYLDVYDPELSYTPQVECFFQTAHELGHPGTVFQFPNTLSSDGKTVGDWYNRLIACIHERTNSREFKEKVRKQAAGIDRNYAVAKQYVDDLFKCYSKLLVVRLELKYRADVAQQAPRMMNRIQKDLDVFMRGMRCSTRHLVFKDQVGYLKVIEYGTKGTGHHAHFVFFFNGSRRQRDWYIAEQIGRYWENITRHDGIWSSANFNRKAATLPNYGIGMVQRLDAPKRRTLQERVVGYLFKSEQILRQRSSPKSKSFSKGELPSECGRRLRNRVHQRSPYPSKACLING